MRVALLFATMLTVPLAACAAQPAVVPGKPLVVKAHPLPPFQVHEECVKLARGDRLDFTFSAEAPLKFNIHYHEGNAVIMPVSRDNVRADSGDFTALIAQDYCLMWEAGPIGTPLDYTVRLRRGKP